ncbi:MAG: LacI family DNA-binding transcriptional regulator [Pseudomonadota bacterium]
MRTTIIDVAALAGVSIKTVSRVLNHEPNVRAATRDKVNEAVNKLGYRPNLQARQLKGTRSYLIGLICGEKLGSYAGPAQLGAIEACRSRGYHLVVETCDAASQDPAVKLAQLLRDTTLDGLLLLPPFGDLPSVTQMVRAHGLPFCSFSPKEVQDDAYTVRMDDEAAAYEMTTYLIELGHRQIGFIKGDVRHAATDHRYAGFRRAMRERQLEVLDEHVQQGDFSYRSGIAAANRLLEGEHRPSAVFASNDDMAAAVVSVAYRHGLVIPRELSVAGFDNSDFSRKIWPTVTTVHQPVYEMGESAVSQLLDGIAGDQTTSVKTLSYRLLFRESTAPPAAE